jgi:cytochrome d ubiquinol oxidase subunit II
LLFCLILRGVTYELRFQWDNRNFRIVCDAVATVASLVATILLGVAFSNLFRGLPIYMDAGVGFHLFQGNILNLLHPYCLLGGVLFVLMFLVHGALYLTWRVTGDLRNKAFYMAKAVWPVFLVVFLVYVALTFFWADLSVNYFKVKPLLALPLLCAILFLVSGYEIYIKENAAKALLASCGGILTLTLTGVLGMFPNLIPSRLDPTASLNIVNSSSSSLTLTIMLVVVIIFVPTVIAYQIWAHKKMAWKIKADY